MNKSQIYESILKERWGWGREGMRKLIFTTEGQFINAEGIMEINKNDHLANILIMAPDLRRIEMLVA